jgi:hypothetical protein
MRGDLASESLVFVRENALGDLRLVKKRSRRLLAAVRAKMRQTPQMLEYCAIPGDTIQRAERAAKRSGCAVCGSPKILRLVGNAGYCGAHVADAFAAARAKMGADHGLEGLGELRRRKRGRPRKEAVARGSDAREAGDC